MPNLVGTGLNQVPTNSMLGGLAYQDPEHASIKDLDLKNLSQINSELAETANDVFVYDTRKDSDGGAWRKRTQHTSWYNETLGTEYRGTRREFPAVAVIVSDASSDKVTIYDGDDPDLPMWMVFSAGNPRGIIGWATGNITRIKLAAMNGIMVVGTNDAGTIFKFVEDFVEIMYSSANYDIKSGRTIADRNNAAAYDSVSGTAKRVFVIATYAINDVAMTVLPNAPIDDATGLPVPTIAVATNSGMSLIKDDRSIVVDWIETSGPDSAQKVNFRNDGKLGVYTSGTSGTTGYPQLYYIDLPSTNISSNYYYNFSALNFERYGGTAWETNATNNLVLKSPSTSPGDHDLTDMVDTPNLTYAATNGGLNAIIRPEEINYSTNRADMFTAAVAYIQKDYNTGYMYGNIKGAFLSDTDTTNITGSEKIANYNFAADFSTQWEAVNNATTSYDATNDRVTVTSTQNYSGIQLKSASLPTLTAGKRYIMTVDIHSITNPIYFGVVSGLTVSDVNAAGVWTGVFTASNVTEVFIKKPTGSNSTFVLNSVSIREAEEDRSVNNDGLQVYGTVNKSAVATGADLVAYSNWSNSNYLKQPHNTGLEIGTNKISITAWFRSETTDTSNYKGLIYLNGPGTLGPGLQVMFGPDNGIYLYVYGASGTQNFGGSYHYGYNDGEWHQIVITTRPYRQQIFVDGVLKETGTVNTGSLTNTASELYIGKWWGSTSSSYWWRGDIALVRVSRNIPSQEQIKKMYNDEKHLFKENAKATLYGSSDAVTALGYDDSTNIIHAGTSAGRSEFQGLRRINNTTTAVTTAISASNGLVAEQ